jgi:hypothetical protein
MIEFQHEYQGRQYQLRVEYPGYLAGTRLSPMGQEYVESILARIDEAKGFAARELLNTYNESWLDDDHGELSAEGFAKLLEFDRLKIMDEPDYATIYFSDGDMFGGHWVEVSFIGTEPKYASIIG